MKIGSCTNRYDGTRVALLHVTRMTSRNATIYVRRNDLQFQRRYHFRSPTLSHSEAATVNQPLPKNAREEQLLLFESAGTNIR